jgi:AAHS family 4-hydroxybenzoate transporter-like MFS transporter
VSLAEQFGVRPAVLAGHHDQVRAVREQQSASLVEAALDAFAAAGADCVVTIDGGSTIDPGKVIAARRKVPFIANPTTLSGSEMTALYGMKIGGRCCTTLGASPPILVLARRRVPRRSHHNKQKTTAREETMSEVSQPELDLSAIIDRSRLSALQWRAILLCAMVAILDGFDTQAIAFVAPVIAREFRVDSAAFGPVFGVGLLGSTIGALILGPAADRFGRKPIIIASTFVFGAFALVTPQAGSLSGLLLDRFLTGLGLGGAMPNIIAITSEYAPRRQRATLVTLMFCGFPLGAVLGGGVSAQLIAAYGWHGVFYVGGTLPLALLPLLWFGLPESIRFLAARCDRYQNHSRELLRIVRCVDPGGRYADDCRWLVNEEHLKGSPIKALFLEGRAIGTMLLWVVYFSNLLILYFLINWLPAVLQRVGLPIERAIIATVALNAGGIVGGLLLGRLVDKRQPYGVLTVAYACAAVLVAAMGTLESGSVLVLMSAIATAGFFIIGTQYCMNALVANFYPTRLRSTGVGWALGIGRIGSIVGPVLGGMLLSFGWSPGTLLTAIAAPAALSSLAVSVLGRWQQKSICRNSTPT